MKKNYILHVIVLTFVFAFQIGQSQNNLASNEYGTLIQNYLDNKKEAYNLTANDVSSLLVTDAYYSKKTRINHVYVNQAYQGIKIHNAVSSVAVRDNYVFHYANALIPNIASKVNTITPVIDAESAINSFVSIYNLGAVSNLQVLETSARKFLFSNGGVSKTDIPVELVFQPTQDGSIKLAWDLSIQALNGKNWYSVRIDALSGAILDTNDWIISCNFGDVNHTDHSSHSTKNEGVNLFKAVSTMPDGSQYNVFPIPLESPNHGSIQLISDPSDVVASPFGWHDIDGVAGAEFTITRGNNVWAQEDANGDDGTGVSPDGGASLVFNFQFNDDQEPIGYQNTSTTNLFYMNNIMHDVLYQYGFDEASGNFQQNNYGNGGAGADFVFADAQDGSGINNATFGTPPDGNNPGMTMFLWSAPSPSDLLTVNSGGPLVGVVTAVLPAGGAGNNITPPSQVPVTGDLAVVDDGTAAPTEGCSPLTNGASVLGKIALIKRGNCAFVDKIQNAQDAGAIGVIVVNHNNPTNDPTYTEYVNMSGNTTPAFTIPSVFINNADGQQIIDAVLGGETINVTLVRNPTFQLDGSVDNGIIAHEYGHGISNRLIGGPNNTNCLNNAEQMGEGWSDWFALMLTMKASDLPETGRGIATYSLGQSINGGGLRPFPYSTDTTVNPLTYDDTNNDASISAPHGIGSIYGTILWDLTWAYIDKYGFDSDVYNGTGGNNKVIQLVIDGLKLQSCNTGFIGGRNSLLAADNALTGGEDTCMIWETFAARGVGVNASEGAPQSRLDQVEDFTMPPDTDPMLANCTFLGVDEFNQSNYSIFPNPTNDVLNIKVKKNFGDVNMTLTDINGRVVLTTTKTLNDTTTLNIGALQSGMYILTIKGEGINTNDKIIKN